MVCTTISQNCQNSIRNQKFYMQIMHFKADWVDPEKTLREQGIMESEIMTIKRKLFIDDCSKIIDNPIQRNMQYEQVIPVLFLET